MPASWTTKITQKKCPKDYTKIKEKYEKYFQGNRILPIPKLVHEVQPKIISFVVTDLKMRRLAGIKKDTFEDLLKAAGIPAKYYCRRSFATWDVLLPSEDLAAKLAGDSITSKYFRLQPEYMGKQRIKITICNVPIQLNEEVLAAFLTIYGDIENIEKAKSMNGTAHGDYILTTCLDRGGFTAIPHILEYKNQAMTVVVEDREPQCWNCKHLGHFSKSCPQKATKIVTPATTTTTTTPSASKSPKPETGDHPDKGEEGWTQVTRGGKKKKKSIAPTEKQTTATNVSTATTVTTTKEKRPSSSSPTTNKNKDKTEAMDTAVNLKRRRDSGDSSKEEGDKKHLKKLTPKPAKEPETGSQPQTSPSPQPKEKKIKSPALPE